MPDDLGIRRIFAGLLGLAEIALEAADFRLDLVEKVGREAVDEQAAVEVVQFVLHGPAEEVVRLDVDRLTVEVVRLDANLAGALDVGVEAGEAQAALLALDRGVP